MASGKGNSPGPFMNSGKGMCSYQKNPMSAPSEVSRRCGPGLNKDQQKADRLLQQAHKQKDSLRGESGM